MQRISNPGMACFFLMKHLKLIRFALYGIRPMECAVTGKIYSFFFLFAWIGLKTPFLGSIMSHRFPEIASIISILTFFRFSVSYDDKELTLTWHKDNPVAVSNSIEIPSYTLANHNWSSDIENFTTGNFISNKNLIGLGKVR